MLQSMLPAGYGWLNLDASSAVPAAFHGEPRFFLPLFFGQNADTNVQLHTGHSRFLPLKEGQYVVFIIHGDMHSQQRNIPISPMP